MRNSGPSWHLGSSSNGCSLFRKPWSEIHSSFAVPIFCKFWNHTRCATRLQPLICSDCIVSLRQKGTCVYKAPSRPDPRMSVSFIVSSLTTRDSVAIDLVRVLLHINGSYLVNLKRERTLIALDNPTLYLTLQSRFSVSPALHVLAL